MKKYIILSLVTLIPLTAGAASLTSSEADSMVTQMKSILDQYAARIKSLEIENAVLRDAVSKAGIQIPLSAYSGMVILGNSTTDTNVTTPPNTTTGSQTTPTEKALDMTGVEKEYGSRYAGFVQRIHTEWTGIQ